MPYCRIPRVSDAYPHPGLFQPVGGLVHLSHFAFAQHNAFRLIIPINTMRNLLCQHVNVIIKLTPQVRPNSFTRIILFRPERASHLGYGIVVA
jgi:hypothetical protein